MSNRCLELNTREKTLGMNWRGGMDILEIRDGIVDMIKRVKDIKREIEYQNDRLIDEIDRLEDYEKELNDMLEG